ncbi:MAG: hypothetical protein MJ102_06915 [Clostridia bacterium]|nr:hypothetical protein [Clostridia bacterium]
MGNNGKTVFDGKKAVFIGNSLIFFGGIVEPVDQRRPNNGIFKRLCTANGDDTEVINCTYGGHHLRDFTPDGCKRDDDHNGEDILAGIDFEGMDYVFFSESGDNNPDFLADSEAVMKRFPNPKTKFAYLCHSYSHFKGHTNITDNLPALKERGVCIIDWGRMVYDIAVGAAQVPGARLTYNKETFINAVGRDYHHPNPLAGYLAAQMCRCVYTGESAVGQDYGVTKNMTYGGKTATFDEYAEKFYDDPGCTNFREVFASEDDMRGLQILVDRYAGLWK